MQLTRETKLRRDAQGVWYDGDDEVKHPKIVRAFNRWIERADDGRYCLRNAVHWAYVTIEGAPIFVRGVELSGQRAILTLSDETTEDLAPATLRLDAEGALYCTVRQGRMPARFERNATLQLGEALAEDEQGLYFALGGGRVYPPTVADPLA